MRNFKPDARHKENYRDAHKHSVFQQGAREQRQFEETQMQKVRVIFVNIGLGRQRTARSFWVLLENELDVEEITKRLDKAFGDLK